MKMLALIFSLAAFWVYPALGQVQQDTAFVRFSGDTVKICHINMLANCEAKLVSQAEVRNDSVIIVYQDTASLHAKCVCKYDVTTNLSGLRPASYVVSIFFFTTDMYPIPHDTLIALRTFSFTIKKPSLEVLASYRVTPCHSSWTSAWVPVSYPLHVGDLWEFSEDLYYKSRFEVLGDTLMPNGRRYAVTQWYWGSQYQRQQGDSVVGYSPRDSSEYLLLDFTRNPGDTVSTRQNFSDTTDITLEATGTRLVFGVPLRYWVFYRNTRQYIDDEMTITVVDSLGVIGLQPSFGPYYVFQGARVNGRVYGNITALPEDRQSPGAFRLEQNYPNPFNPVTTIGYALPHRSKVNLTLFNLLGETVSELVNGEVEAGYHEVKFDGAGLASGVYFYRLQSGDVRLTRTLLLLR